MDFRLTEKERALKREFEVFFEAEMKNAPLKFGNNSPEGRFGSDEGWEFHTYMARQMAGKGWLSMSWPKEYGGHDASIMEQVLFSEVKEYFDAPGIDLQAVKMFAPSLLSGANEEQKRRLLPPIAAGEAFYCQGWSEPDAGSDLAALSTMAIREGDEYIVNGQKTWTSGAHRTEFMFLLARTDPESKRGKGLSVFHLRTDYPGIEIRPLHTMDGKHTYNEVFFKDVRIPAKDRIGEEGEGWALSRETMNNERSGVGGVAGAKRMLDEIIAYSKTTHRNGAPLSKNPVTLRKIAELYIGSQIGQTLAYKVAAMQQKKDFAGMITAASESKCFSTEFALQTASYGTEILGQHGQLESGRWAPLDGSLPEAYQGLKGATIYAGSNEIQRNLIAWTGLGLPRLKFK